MADMTREEAQYTTLDTEQCKWWVNTLFNMAKEKAFNSHNFDDAEEIQSAQDKIIKALEQKPRWIPVSERLPEGYCMFCDIDGDVFYGHIYDKKWWAEGQDDRIKNVIAWMPTPEPYKAESEEI